MSDARDQVRSAEAAQSVALADERRRIARELHDVVSHAVTVVVLQARGARSVLDTEPELTRQALDCIEIAGREGLDEMRRLVELLRETSAEMSPQPGVADIDSLVATVRASGAEVDLTVTGDPLRLGAGAQLTTFRLVQECLTNAIRHSPGSPIRVILEEEQSQVTVSATNHILGATPARAPIRSGRLGLVGMKERVELYGGTLTYGPRSETEWMVVGQIPMAPTVLAEAK